MCSVADSQPDLPKNHFVQPTPWFLLAPSVFTVTARCVKLSFCDLFLYLMDWRSDLTWALPLSRRHAAVRFFGSHFHKPLSLLSYSSAAFEFIVRHI